MGALRLAVRSAFKIAAPKVAAQIAHAITQAGKASGDHRVTRIVSSIDLDDFGPLAAPVRPSRFAEDRNPSNRVERSRKSVPEPDRPEYRVRERPAREPSENPPSPPIESPIPSTPERPVRRRPSRSPSSRVQRARLARRRPAESPDREARPRARSGRVTSVHAGPCTGTVM